MIGRFTTIDRFAEKYKRYTPYHYGADNPIRNIDINGDSLKTTGSQSATASMKQVAETGMGGSVTMSQNNNGVWDMTQPSTYDLEGMTPEQTSMYNTMNDAVTGQGMASFNLVDEKDPISNNVFVGDNGTAKDDQGNWISATPGVHTIDMGDVSKFGTTGALTSQGALGHELSEGVAIQTKGATPNDAHFKTAIPTENGINGTTSKGAELNTVNGVTTVSVPVNTGHGTKVVTITFTNGNIKPGDVKNNDK